MNFTLVDITDNSYVNINNGLTNAIVFIVLKKTFDTTDREILVSKLELYMGLKVQALSFSETTSLIELRLQL